MEELSDDCPDKPKKVFSAVHWLLVAIVVLSAACFVYALVRCASSVGRYGFPTTSDIDLLTGVIALAGTAMLLDGIARRLRSGEPPFTQGNARAFRLMAAIVLVKIIVSVVAQFLVSNVNPALGMNVVFSVDAVLAMLVFYLLHIIFKYGTTLQAEVQDLV